MKCRPLPPRITASGARPRACASDEYHLTRLHGLEFGDVKGAAALSPTLMDAQEAQAMRQWRNALLALRRALSGDRR